MHEKYLAQCQSSIKGGCHGYYEKTDSPSAITPISERKVKAQRITSQAAQMICRTSRTVVLSVVFVT